MDTWNTKVLFAVIALTLLPFGAQAQGTDDSDIEVRATVLEALTAIPVNDLSFGNLVQGQSRTVSPEDPEAGRFAITGETTSEVALTFTLPSELSNNIDPSETINTSFSATSARRNTVDDASAGTAFDPSVGDTALLSSGGELYVYIGGMVETTINQIPGDYVGSITLTVEYTGN